MSAPTVWPDAAGRSEPQPLTEDDLDRHITSRAPGRYLHTRPAVRQIESCNFVDTIPTQPAPMAAEAATSVGADQDDAPKPQMRPMEAVGLVIVFVACALCVIGAIWALAGFVGRAFTAALAAVLVP